jgi:geranylgeranyl pyrophosphate synthase
MATLVHDDLVDGARMRRGVPSAWSLFGADAALAAGDYLFACAFAELADTSDSDAVAVLAEACLALARGEAMQRRQTRNPETTIDDYLARCALKTGKLFEAACLLGSGGELALGCYGLALGIAFQIADDILDCAGQTQETGKIPGSDLREGTPTMPLLYAAQEDTLVRAALAGGPLDGALARVAATEALERSREAALDYAAKARTCLGSQPRREELESLTYAVVDRAS